MKTTRPLAAALLAGVAGLIVRSKVKQVHHVPSNRFFGTYSILVGAYLFSQFGLSLFYKPRPTAQYEPTVAVIIPAYNEESAIAACLQHALGLDYPADKLSIHVVNDGSTDSTLSEIEAFSGDLNIISYDQNRGKRNAMAQGIRASDSEVLLFVDSDSMVNPEVCQALVHNFADHNVGAVAGDATVRNRDENWVTRMQEVRYYVAFKVVKGAESLFRTVICCSGCNAAYRRAAIDPILDEWEFQSVFGRVSKVGDDRALTNYVLRDGWDTIYESRAKAETIVPNTLKGFLRQQLRWKRSWVRESWRISHFAWKRHPAIAIVIYVGIILPLFAPITTARALVREPVQHITNMVLVSLLGGLYYALREDKLFDSMWLYGSLYNLLYIVCLVWQQWIAVVTVRSEKWITR